jgi:zinc/manganese transport system substrate-binding protein
MVMLHQETNMKSLLISAAALLALACSAAQVRAEVLVLTTDPTLAYIAREVGGPLVRAESLARGTDDPHSVEPRPSMVVKLSRAQVFARIGMDLDMWADGLLEKAGNAQVMRGGKGYADCSQNLRVLEIPPAKLDPSMGDIHVYGNPHYLMDPANGILAAGNIAAALIRVDPSHRAEYDQRFRAFGGALAQRLKEWRERLAPYRGALVTTYHRSWVYFMARFGLKEFGTVEPKPGVPPSPGHVQNLIREMRNDHVTAILVEDFRSHRFPDMVAAATGARAAYVPLAVEGEQGVDTYFKLFDTIVGRLAAALKG